MMDGDFVIQERLLADTHTLGDYAISHVLLHSNATIPWFMLVPRCDETEFLDLPEAMRADLLAEAARTGDFVRRHFGSSKINFAAIGNIVPQMHLHVVGRYPGDACWPAPVWGSSIEVKNYTEDNLKNVITEMRKSCGLT